jgi:hypothetical protein
MRNVQELKKVGNYCNVDALTAVCVPDNVTLRFTTGLAHHFIVPAYPRINNDMDRRM